MGETNAAAETHWLKILSLWGEFGGELDSLEKAIAVGENKKPYYILFDEKKKIFIDNTTSATKSIKFSASGVGTAAEAVGATGAVVGVVAAVSNPAGQTATAGTAAGLTTSAPFWVSAGQILSAASTSLNLVNIVSSDKKTTQATTSTGNTLNPDITQAQAAAIANNANSVYNSVDLASETSLQAQKDAINNNPNMTAQQKQDALTELAAEQKEIPQWLINTGIIGGTLLALGLLCWGVSAWIKSSKK
jgi:hypothetical protein